MQLEFRTLNIQFNNEPWARDASSLHACTLERPWTRKTCFSQMTGGYSQVVSTEIPVAASTDDPTPYYPMEIPRNQEIFACLSAQIRECYPNLYLAGRLGSYRYFDMYQAVGQALTLADRLWSTQRESARRVI
jgi:UDP-galactopyranose mutase